VIRDVIAAVIADANGVFGVAQAEADDMSDEACQPLEHCALVALGDDVVAYRRAIDEPGTAGHKLRRHPVHQHDALLAEERRVVTVVAVDQLAVRGG
jgi:hypothetical protein